MKEPRKMDVTERESDELYETREPGRVEAFSDGVFAVAITLLVLEIKIPAAHDLALVHDLLSQWPQYVAYVYSFVIIGIYWMNHHHIFKYIRRVDQVLLFFNVVSLLWIVLMPFGAGLLAEYIGRERTLEQYAALVFSGLGLFTGIHFAIVWRYAAWQRHLLQPGLDEGVIKSLTRDYDLGIVFCAAALALVFVNVPLSLGLTLAIGMFFARPARMRSARAVRRPSHPLGPDG